MLSLFLETPSVFTDDFIIDELMDFFFAGTVTTQYTSQTMLTHLCQKPESLIRVRTEFDKVITEMYPDEKSSSKRDQLDRLVKTDSLMEMEYLNMIMQEAIRFEPPAP